MGVSTGIAVILFLICIAFIIILFRRMRAPPPEKEKPAPLIIDDRSFDLGSLHMKKSTSALDSVNQGSSPMSVTAAPPSTMKTPAKFVPTPIREEEGESDDEDESDVEEPRVQDQEAELPSLTPAASPEPKQAWSDVPSADMSTAGSQANEPDDEPPAAAAAASSGYLDIPEEDENFQFE